MNVFVSFNQDRQPVMSIEYCPVRSNLQRARCVENYSSYCSTGENRPKVPIIEIV